MAERTKIVVAGAGGFVGGALRQALAARGARVVRLVRRAAEGDDVVRWDPAGRVENVSALEGAAAVIHLGGESLASGFWTAARKRCLRDSRIVSTRTLAGMLARLDARPDAFLTASAVGWYGSRGDEVLDETSARGSGFLADLCHEWEGAAEPARRAGIRWSALRSGIVLGKSGGALAKMAPAFRLGLGAVLGDGRQWTSWIALEDEVAAVLHVLDAGLEGPVNLVAPSSVTNREFTKALAAAVGRPAFLRAPAFALGPLGELGREMLLASQRVVPRKLLESGFRFRIPTVESAFRRALQ